MDNFTLSFFFYSVSSTSGFSHQPEPRIPTLADAFSLTNTSSFDTDSSVRPLWEESCQSNDSIHYDCFSSCGNGGAFNSIFDLQNCLTLLFAFRPLSYPQYTVSNPPDFSVVDGSSHAVGKYVSSKDVSTLIDQTATSIWNCLKTECEMLDACPSLGFPTSAFTQDVLESASRQVSYICSLIPTPLDPDLAGIGVYISYWMQIGLAIIFFVLSLALKGLSYSCRKWSPPSKRSKNIGVVVQRQLSYLNDVMVDFHKAQCFFTIAINVAAVKVSVSSDTNAGSLQVLYKTHVFLQTIAVGSCLPITFTLLNLHVVNKTFWYLAILSLISLTFGATTLGILGTFKMTEARLKELNRAFQEGGPTECSLKQPWVYCDLDDGTVPRDPYVWGIGKLAVCETITLILLLSKLNLWRHLGQRVFKSHVKATKPSSSHSKGSFALTQEHTKYNEQPNRRFKFLRFFLGAVMIGGLCYLLNVHMSFLKTLVKLKYSNNNWGFGQVVALLVWVPCVCEWAHLQLCGGKEGRKYRVIAPYEIIETFEFDHG